MKNKMFVFAVAATCAVGPAAQGPEAVATWGDYLTTENSVLLTADAATAMLQSFLSEQLDRLDATREASLRRLLRELKRVKNDRLASSFRVGEALLEGSPHALSHEEAEEYSLVTSGRVAVPRFVASWNPATDAVDWSLQRNYGVIPRSEAERKRFSGYLYVRHIKLSRDVGLRDVCAVMAESQVARDACDVLGGLEVLLNELLGPGAAEMLSCVDFRGETLLPWRRLRDAQELNLSGDTTTYVTNVLDAVRFASTAASIRGDVMRLALRLGTRPAEATLGEAFISEAWCKVRREAAVATYVAQRQTEVVDTTGPITGVRASWFVEPDREFWAQFSRICARARTWVKRLDDITSNGEELDRGRYYLAFGKACEALAATLASGDEEALVSAGSRVASIFGGLRDQITGRDKDGVALGLDCRARVSGLRRQVVQIEWRGLRTEGLAIVREVQWIRKGQGWK